MPFSQFKFFQAIPAPQLNETLNVEAQKLINKASLSLKKAAFVCMSLFTKSGCQKKRTAFSNPFYKMLHEANIESYMFNMLNS